MFFFFETSPRRFSHHRSHVKVSFSSYTNSTKILLFRSNIYTLPLSEKQQTFHRSVSKLSVAPYARHRVNGSESPPPGNVFFHYIILTIKPTIFSLYNYVRKQFWDGLSISYVRKTCNIYVREKLNYSISYQLFYYNGNRVNYFRLVFTY